MARGLDAPMNLQFKPKLFEALQGYNRQRFFKDLGAGLTVSVVALPLAMAFAIASGLQPNAGLVTAIVAGFLISALGGSRVQIGGPAGAFIVIVYGIVLQHGFSGLLLATLLSSVWLLLMGLLRLGVLIRFIPVAVIIGFTNGIAVLVCLSQLKDFMGLSIAGMPADGLGILTTLAQHGSPMNSPTLTLTCSCLLLLVLWQFGMPRLLPHHMAKRLAVIPGAMLVLVLATAAVYALHWPVETLGSRFGELPTGLPPWVWPTFSWASLQAVLPASLTLGLLGGIESLLCARVADSMIDDRHDPNQELLAQGIANLVMPFVGGMPATGTIARTVMNVKNGASSPIAGMVHALGLLLMVLLAAPWVFHIPVGALSAILMMVAFNMGEWRAFAQLKQFRWPYRFSLLAVFALTVLVDLTVAIEVGLLAACLTLVYRISSLSRCVALHQSPSVQVWGLQGALFFGAVDLLENLAQQLPTQALVLDCSGLIYMDASGADALQHLHQRCRKVGVQLALAGLNQQASDLLRRTGFLDSLGAAHLHPDWAHALQTLSG
mgnify:CR=1 FL=1